MTRSQEMYAGLADAYDRYAGNRRAYLDAVDRLILDRAPKGTAHRYLDVGAGDGRRTAVIAAGVGAASVTVVDNCGPMLAGCRTHPSWRIVEAPLEEFADDAVRYDLITCLWNVLGHVEDDARRGRALRNLRSLSAPGGQIFIDVNNRYNAGAYGMWRCARNMALDAVRRSDRTGDISFTLRIGHEAVPSSTHLFSPFEIRRLIRDAGLRVVDEIVVDYRTGRVRRSVFAGQMLFELAAA